AVFPLPSALEIGFVLAVVAPTASFERSRPNRSTVAAVSSFDPTNYVHFLDHRVALRTAGDLRVLWGRFVIQGRHGVDVIIDAEAIERVKTAGRLMGHVGWLIRPDLEASVEAAQAYFFSSDDIVVPNGTAQSAFDEKYRISDAHRSYITIGPNLRMT